MQCFNLSKLECQITLQRIDFKKSMMIFSNQNDFFFLISYPCITDVSCSWQLLCLNSICDFVLTIPVQFGAAGSKSLRGLGQAVLEKRFVV